MRVHLTIPIWALLGTACVQEAPAPTDTPVAEAAVANCAPADTMRGDADDHAETPVAAASADPCQDTDDLAAVVGHIDALSEILEGDDDATE